MITFNKDIDFVQQWVVVGRLIICCFLGRLVKWWWGNWIQDLNHSEWIQDHDHYIGPIRHGYLHDQEHDMEKMEVDSESPDSIMIIHNKEW